MPRHNGPSSVVIPVGALIVVIAATIAGSFWGAKAFVATCLVASILTGLLVTGGE